MFSGGGIQPLNRQCNGCDSFFNDGGNLSQVEVESKVNLNYLEDHMRVLLFRAVRELLFNIVKHAHTTRAEVTLDQTNGCVSVTVRDAGAGFDVEAVMTESSMAHGLLIVQDRLSLMGGKMEITSSPGQGTEVKIEAPLEASSA